MNTMAVGKAAQANSHRGLMPLKYLPRMACPAGLGALAITVRPPPVTAPATTEYLTASGRLGTVDARKVTAALSLNAVSSVGSGHRKADEEEETADEHDRFMGEEDRPGQEADVRQRHPHRNLVIAVFPGLGNGVVKLVELALLGGQAAKLLAEEEEVGQVGNDDG